MEEKIKFITSSDLSLNDNIKSAKTIFDNQSKRIGNIYQQPIFTLPSDDKDDYIAAKFEGPKEKSNRLHAFPRLGYTNDITSLMSLLPVGLPGDRLNKLSSNFIEPNNPINLTIDGQPLQPVAPKTTSQTYTTKDGSDYAKGIAGVAVIVFAIYLLWGLCLILLRCGRMDCCFRMCQYGDKAWRKRRSRRRRSMNQSSGDGDVNSGVRGEEDEEDEDTGCCCYTCHERLAMKGGCCTRHIFCGWMAGKSIKLPTSSSIRRENEMREKSFIKFEGIKCSASAVGKGVTGVGSKVSSGIVASAKSMKNGSSAVVKEGSENSQDDVPVAETAVAATTEDETPPDTANTEEPQDPLPPTTSWIAEKQRINQDYLLKRQASARRTILTLRIVFLVASTLVLVCSSVLLAKGWQGVNAIVDSSQDTLHIVNEQVSWMMEGIEEYVNANEQLKQDRLDFKARTEESNAEGNVGWCPALVGNGEIEVVIPLSQMLLRGNLLKLAFVEEVQEKASNIKDTAEDLVGKAQETAGVVKDTVGDVNLNVDSAAEVANNARKVVEVVGWGEAVADKAGVNTSEVVDDIKDTVGEVAEVVEDTVEVVKEKTMTVITFLDQIKDRPFIGKVLKVASNKATDVIDDQLDEKKRIAKIVATLRGLVKTLVKRISDEDAQRLLQSDVVSQLKETEVTKDGIKYIVLDLVDNGADSIGLDYGDGIIFRGYNLTELFNTNITVTLDVANLSETVNQRLGSVSSRITEIFTTLYTGLENVQYQTQSAQTSLDSILPYYYVAVSFIFVIMGLTLIFMIAVVLAWKDKQPRLFRHMNDAIVCPIFIISTLFMWIFTIVFLILGLVGGDFCFETPDNQVTQMMEQVLTGVSRIAYNFGSYYVNGCPKKSQPRLMGITFKVITTAWNGMAQLGGLLKSVGAGPMSLACGNAATDGSDDNPIQAVSMLAVSIAEHFSYAARAVFGLAEIVLCRSFNPIYTSLAHKILCTDFINLVTPLLWCMFVISICSMVMITLRVAWYELLPADVKGVESDESKEADEEENAEVDESTPTETRAIMERDAGVDEEESMPQTERGDDVVTDLDGKAS